MENKMVELKNSMVDEAIFKVNSLKDIDVTTETYKNASDSINKLVSSLTELENQEQVDKNNNYQREEDLKDRKINRRTKIIDTLAAISVPVIMGLISLKYDKDGVIITTEAGKSSLKRCLNFFKK